MKSALLYGIIGVVVAVAAIVGVIFFVMPSSSPPQLTAGQQPSQQVQQDPERQQILDTPNTGPATAAAQEPPVNQTEEKIATLLKNDPNRINDPEDRFAAMSVIRAENMGDTASLIIISNLVSWTANLQNTKFTQWTVDGAWSKPIDFTCEKPNGIFSVVVQKNVEQGYLKVYVAQSGQVLQQGGTGAAYGIVSVSGVCK